MSLLESYHEGSLGHSGPPWAGAYHEGSLGAPPWAGSYREGVLGGGAGVFGATPPAVTRTHGVLGTPGAEAYHEGVLGAAEPVPQISPTPMLISPSPALLTAGPLGMPTKFWIGAVAGVLIGTWWYKRQKRRGKSLFAFTANPRSRKRRHRRARRR